MMLLAWGSLKGHHSEHAGMNILEKNHLYNSRPALCNMFQKDEHLCLLGRKGCLFSKRAIIEEQHGNE